MLGFVLKYWDFVLQIFDFCTNQRGSGVDSPPRFPFRRRRTPLRALNTTMFQLKNISFSRKKSMFSVENPSFFKDNHRRINEK